MASDWARRSRIARGTTAWATVAGLALMGLAFTIELTEQGTEFDGAGTRYVAREGSYLVAVDVFWSGDRMTGVWHAMPVLGGGPDEVRLVAGSDVARILAGDPPEHLYGSFPAWNQGSFVGDMNFVVPGFRCRGPTGGCEQGDLPAVVFTKGNAWVGQPVSALQRAGDGMEIAGFDLVRNDPWVQPAIQWMAAAATTAVLVAAGAAVAWGVASRRAPKEPVPWTGPEPSLESSLHLMALSRLYLASIARSLYLGGGLASVLFVVAQAWGIGQVDAALESHLPMGGEAVEAWVTTMHWLILPFAYGVAAAFWLRRFRQLRDERRRWGEAARRVSDLARQVTG